MRSRADINERIWKGRYWGRGGAMRDALHYYRALPPDIEARVVWMSDLYSALGRTYPEARRLSPQAIGRTLWCLWYLKPQVRFFADAVDSNTRRGELTADQCDVISTVLLRWSQLPLAREGRYLDAAEGYVRLGLGTKTARVHTTSLLHLTRARISVRRGKKLAARSMVRLVLESVDDVADVNQRARVLRSCAELVHALPGDTWDTTPRELLERADLPGIGEDVRAKNLETRRALGLAA